MGRASEGQGVRASSDHPSSLVNFPPFLVPGMFGKFGKFTTHHPNQPALIGAFAASPKPSEPLAHRNGPGTPWVAVGVRES